MELAELLGRSGHRSGSGETYLFFLFVSAERNKITEVLLRWAGISELFVGVCQVRLGCWVHGANPPALLPGGMARPIFK